MPDSADRDTIRDLAYLYLYVAQGTDKHLTDVERSFVISRLQERFPLIDEQRVQSTVHDTMISDDAVQGFIDASDALSISLSRDQKKMVLEDLQAVAQADGVVLRNEQRLVERLQARWGLDGNLDHSGAGAHPRLDWTLLHHLAFIYVVMAHGPDRDLHEEERRTAITRLRQWQPERDETEVAAILEEAAGQYGLGPDERLLTDSVGKIGDLLPELQKQAALYDLIQIANADGIFLDTEEDLITSLMSAWELDAGVAYGRFGRK